MQDQLQHSSTAPALIRRHSSTNSLAISVSAPGQTQHSRPSSRAGSAGSRPQSRVGDAATSFRPIECNEFYSLDLEGDVDSFMDDVANCETEEAVRDGPAEWDGANPDTVLGRLKALKESVISPLGLRSFYKSYSNWSKLNPDQQDKALAWFHKLPDHIQC
jgi:hypothetical protein